jgi:hypothetical protein
VLPCDEMVPVIAMILCHALLLSARLRIAACKKPDGK